jgi:hypothetical protein
MDERKIDGYSLCGYVSAILYSMIFESPLGSSNRVVLCTSATCKDVRTGTVKLYISECHLMRKVTSVPSGSGQTAGHFLVLQIRAREISFVGCFSSAY